MSLVFVFAFTFLIVLVMFSVYYGDTLYTLIGFITLVVAVIGTGIYTASSERDQVFTQRAEAQQTWVRNGCYVYDYECGGKAKYACSIKTNEKNAVMIGDQILKTRRTC